jgi:hypothetical protein
VDSTYVNVYDKFATLLKTAFFFTLIMLLTSFASLYSSFKEVDARGVPQCISGLNSCYIFGWLIVATFIRFNHASRVCSGDFLSWEQWDLMLSSGNYKPYLIIKGAFLKTYIVLWWLLPLLMFCLLIAFSALTNRLIG